MWGVKEVHLYYYLAMHEDIKEKYDEINYRTLEEIDCLDAEEAYEVELFWVDLNSAGKERCSRYRGKSEPLDLFFHDMKAQTGFLSTRLYPEYEMIIRNEALARITPEEEDKGFADRECRIICYEEMIRSLAQYRKESNNKGDYVCEGYTIDNFAFRFYLPKEIPEQIFSGSDLEFFTSPMQERCQFQLSELGAAVLFKYVLAAYYYALVEYKPKGEKARDLKYFFVGLA